MEWFETFFQGLFNEVMISNYSPTSPNAEDYASIIIQALGLKKGQRVLDIPCGRGRISIPLVQKGVKVAGVDFKQAYIAALKRHAFREGVSIQCFKKDMREINFNAEFDAAFNFGGSFGYFDDSGNKDFCRCLFKAIRPGGKLLVEIPNREIILRKFMSSYEEKVGKIHISVYNRFENSTGRMESRWVMTERNKRKKDVRNISVRLYTCAELRQLFKLTGFQETRFFAYPPLAAYKKNSLRVIAVAKKM